VGLKTIIGTTPGREAWLAQCLASVAGRDVFVVSLEAGYELGKIKWIHRQTNFERFLFLQDSSEVLSPDFWTRLDEFDGSVALMSDPRLYGCYMGVYERSVLDLLDYWPETNTKELSIRNEIDWTQAYCDAAKDVPVMFPELRDSVGFEQEHLGRTNLVLQNDLFRKWKGTWH